MVRLTLRAGAACALALAISALSIPGAAQTWIRSVAVGSNPSVASMATVPAGGYILAGTVSGGDGTMDGLLVRLDASGALLWARSYTTGGASLQESFASVKATSDGGFVAAGKAVHPVNDPSAAWLVKTDASGNLSWQRLYGEYDGLAGDSDDFRSVAQTSDGGYIVAGETNSFNTSDANRAVYLMKLDASGAIAWQKRDAPGSHDRASAVLAAQRSDGDFVTVGWAGNGTSSWDAYALRSSQGTGAPYYYPPGYTLGSFCTGLTGYLLLEVLDAVQKSDGSLVVVGTATTTSWTSHAFACGLNASGQLVWSRTLGATTSYTSLTRVIEVPAGGVLALGSGVAGNGGNEAWAVRLDASGNRLWERTYGGTGSDGLGAAAPDGSGGFYLAGATSSFPSGQGRLFLVHTDANGDVASYCGLVKSPASTNASPGGASTDYGAGGYNVSSSNGAYTGSLASLTATPTALCPVTCVAPSGVPASGASDLAACSATGVQLTWGWGVTDWGDGGYGSHTVTLFRDGSPIASGGCSGAFTSPTASCTDTSGTANQSYTYGARFTNGCALATDTAGVAAADGMTAPTASAGVQTALRCLGSPHYFYATPSCGKPPYTYAWDFQNDGSWDSALQNPSFTYAAAATYTWKFRLTDALAATYETTGSATASTAAPPCCVLDAYEPDDTFAQGAVGLTGGSVQSHNFCDDAEDWVSVNACAFRPYTFQTQNLASGTDTVLELYGPDGTTLLASDDDGGGGKASRLQWSTSSDGIYHLRVRQKDGATDQALTYELACSGDTTPCRTWGASIHYSDSDYGRTLTPLPDGTFVMAGFTLVGGSYRWWVQRFGPSGAVLWQTRFDSNTSQIGGAALARDGGVVLAGNTPANGTDLLVVKLSANGDVLWQKSYGGTNSEYGYDVAATPDGGFVVVGEARSYSPANYGAMAWILRLDADGNPLWQRLLGKINCAVYGYGVTVTPAGEVWAGGYMYLAPGYAGWVAHLDAGGNPLWTRSLSITGNSIDGQSRLASDASGNAYLPLSLSGYGGLLKFTPGNTLAWAKRYTGGIQSVALLPDGTGALAGSFGGAYSMARLDSSGAVSWAKKYTQFGGDTAFAVCPLPDGGFGLGGQRTSPSSGKLDFALWKVAADGSVGSSCTGATTISVTVATLSASLGDPSFLSTTSSATPSTVALGATTSTSSPNTLCSWTASPPVPLEVSPPGAAAPLKFSAADTLVWEDKGLNGATTFNLYRGTVAALAGGSFGSCAQPGLTSSTATLSESPPAGGECYTYLVTGKNATGEGILGRRSDGQVETNTSPCP